MNIQTILERLALPKHSHAIYTTIRKHGPLLASHIITRSGVHRPATYRALRSLLKHKFVFTSHHGKRRLYHAAHQNIITTTFTQTTYKDVQKITQNSIETDLYLQKKIIFLTGKDAVRKAFDDVIEHTPKGETFYRYTSEKDLAEVNRILPKNYRLRRDAKKLERLVISNPLSGKQKRPRLERFIKYIPHDVDQFQQNIIQLVYGDRISLIDLNALQTIIIENKALAEFQKVIFKQLYRNLSDK